MQFCLIIFIVGYFLTLGEGSKKTLLNATVCSCPFTKGNTPTQTQCPILPSLPLLMSISSDIKVLWAQNSNLFWRHKHKDRHWLHYCPCHFLDVTWMDVIPISQPGQIPHTLLPRWTTGLGTATELRPALTHIVIRDIFACCAASQETCIFQPEPSGNEQVAWLSVKDISPNGDSRLLMHLYVGIDVCGGFVDAFVKWLPGGGKWMLGG